MKKLLALLTVVANMIIVGCNEMELPSEESGEKKDDKKDNVVAPDSSDTFTVATLDHAGDGDFIALKGYIVGYMPTNTIKKVVFGADDAVTTNIVLADKANETDSKQCAGLQLKADTDAREDLNLADNPAMLGQRIIAYGYKGTYCNAPGLKKVETYELVEGEDEVGEDNGGNDGGSDSKGENNTSFPTLVPDVSSQAFEGC